MSAVATVDHARASAPTPADVGHVLGLIGGYQVSQAIYAAAELKLADLLAGAGFSLVHVSHMAAPTSLIEARRV